MNIKRIRIKNFRGIKETGWIYFNNISAIVGKNDAGKSTVLHAINEFYNENKLLEGNRYCGADDSATEIEICFEMDASSYFSKVLLDKDGYLHIKKSADCIGDTYKNTIMVYDFEKDEYKNIYQLTIAKINALLKKRNKETITDANKEVIDAIVAEILEEESVFVEEEYEIKASLLKKIIYESYPQFSLFLADTSLDTSATSFQNQFKKIVTNAIEAHIEDFSNLQKEVNATLTEEIEKIGRYMKTHYSGLTELKPDISYEWQKLINFDVVMKDSLGNDINLANKGTGIQRLFMVSYFQYLAEQTTESSHSYIFAIEEPETFLHPGAQRTLLDSLKQISNMHQVIITTHSPVFASEIDNGNIIVALKEDEESVYNQGDQISADLLVEELGVRASDSIVNCKLLVFVEGSNDVKFWERIYSSVHGTSYEKDGILFVPGGGTELHNIAEMNLMSKLNRNFIVIVDKDAGAVDYHEKLKKQDKLRKVVSEKGGELIVLRKREIENYYSPRILMELLSRKIEVEEIEIEPYEDVQDKIKALAAGKNIQMKIKGNMEIFEKMNLDDWKAVSEYDEGGVLHYELIEIVDFIRKRAANR